MSRLSLSREKWLLLVAGVSLVLLLSDRLLLSPAIARWQERADVIQTLESQITVGTALVDQEARWLRWRRDMDERLLPASSSQAESQLLASVDTWARQAGLKLNALRPAWKEAGDEGQMLELQVAGTGEMRQVVAFLQAIETTPVAIAVDQLELVPGREKATVLTLNVRLSAKCRAAALTPTGGS